MDSNPKLTHEEIKKLKCATCSNYLSHFPVHTSGDQNVCGRCSISSGSYVKNEIYAIVTQNMHFPCRYRSEGCCETLVPKHIPQHEEQCLYKTSECLTQKFTACFAKVSYPNMKKHCSEKHSEYFLKDAEFSIDTRKSQEYNYLLGHDNDFFSIRSEFTHTDKLFVFTLSRRVHYKLKLTCGSRSLSMRFTDEESTGKLYLDTLISLEESEISVKIYLGTKMVSEDLHKELSDLWKCSFCQGYISLLNVFSESAICCKCQNLPHVDKVSMFTKLHEIVTTLVRFPCENANDGCCFTGHLLQVQNHREFCQFGAQICPLNDFAGCTWSGPAKNVEWHLWRDHRPINVTSSFGAGSTLNLQIPYKSRCDSPEIKFYILKYSHYYFNFVCVQQEQRFYWVMQIFGDFKDIFRYEIRMYGNSDNLPQLSIIQACSKKSSKRELLDNLHNYYYVSLDQHNILNTSDSINFTLRIFNK